MKNIFKLMVLFLQHPLFSIKLLRNIRNFTYAKLYGISNIYVAEYVKIVQAHRNKDAKFVSKGKLNIGEYVYIDYSGGIEIGSNIAISEGAKIFTHNHNVHGIYKNWNLNPISFSKLIIEDNAWIGANAIILESVKTIGEGSIIAAGSVLTKNTEPYGIYAGNPAKKIGVRVVEENQ
ncbi:acyltransferase [Acinetobacter johnsonii]|uniref:acyltransferase n=1 Tax=Acinetobacter johnsonii TaxID=40214 RepID=UPI001F3DC92A|nr:acyltransferase [Acinetobacter johnsonii]